MCESLSASQSSEQHFWCRFTKLWHGRLLAKLFSISFHHWIWFKYNNFEYDSLYGSFGCQRLSAFWEQTISQMTSKFKLESVTNWSCDWFIYENSSRYLDHLSKSWFIRNNLSTKKTSLINFFCSVCKRSCINFTWHFNAGTALSFRWSFGDGTSDVITTVPNVNKTFSTKGCYNVNCTAYNIISSNSSKLYQICVQDTVIGIAINSSISGPQLNTNFLVSVSQGSNYLCNMMTGDGGSLV